MLEDNGRYISALIMRNTFALSVFIGTITLFLIYWGVYEYQPKTDYGLVGFYLNRHSYIITFLTLISSLYYLLLYIKNVRLFYEETRRGFAQKSFSGYVGFLPWAICTFCGGYSVLGLAAMFGFLPFVKDSYGYLAFGLFALAFVQSIGAVFLHMAWCHAYWKIKNIKK